MYVDTHCTTKMAAIFFFNDTATTEIYTLSLHDALPISSTSCRGRELGGVHRSIVYAVEGVVGFKNELYLDALCERDALSDSRIERNEVGKIEGVPAESRRTVGAAVAVCI